MSIWGRLTRKARWWRWRAVARRRLAALGIDLVVETSGTPTFGRPPEFEVSRDGAPLPDSVRGRLLLRLGLGVHLGTGAIIEVAERGSGTIELDDLAYFQGPVRITLLEGGHVQLATRASLRDCIVRCSGGAVRLGRRARIGYGSVVHCANRIVLHDDVGLAERCGLIDSDHSHDGTRTWFLEQPISVGTVELGENTFIAAGAVVLRDARIAGNSVVAANAVVRGGDYPPSSLLAGAPARVVRTLAPEEAPAL